MNPSQFFVHRPVFASVLSLLIFISGAVALVQLPVTEYPDVVPPTVVVTASYPGAHPEVISETVASPLEQAINGVADMLYMSSQSTSDGTLSLTVTFALGTDPDDAQVSVQNRVTRALPRLPEEVQRLGVTTEKSSPNLTMVVHLLAADDRYDMLYLSNYAELHVRDELARVEGVGETRVFGAGNYALRIWLDPEKVAALNLTTSEILDAIREQNRQVAAGALGAPPSTGASDYQLLVTVKGRLTSEQEFAQIILSVGDNGAITRLQDVARIELGSDSYAFRSLLNNQPAAAIAIFQSSDANAIAVSNDIRATMAGLKQTFPQGVDYSIVYDPTVFVRGSIEAVVKTLFEALLLVVVVVVVFLQTWRASVIPLAAVPVSLVGTFAVMHLAGFSLNALSLFGLVLSIGIVVDDAIVVVENVERHIRSGKSPPEATKQAMREVTGPIIATSLVLSAVFIPTAFISGLSGQFYKQFALTIAISTIISTVNSLTLSPALCAALLKPQAASKDWLTKILDGLFARWLFTPFNAGYGKLSAGYQWTLHKLIRASVLVLLVYAALVFAGYQQFMLTPTGFVPTQDKQYLISFAQLPDAASLDRTGKVVRQMSGIILEHPGVEAAVAFPGLSISGFSAASNSGVVFVTLKPFAEREAPELSAAAISEQLNNQLTSIQEAFIAVFPPPPVLGLGTSGGFKLQIEDRSNLGHEALYRETQNILEQAWQRPELDQVFSAYQIKVPQINVEVDRAKAMSHGVSLNDVFDTLQVYLGAVYVNDFNRFGRTYQVILQAQAEQRQDAEQVARLQVINSKGDAVPLASFITIHTTADPDRVQRYNGYVSADINAGPAAGYSSGQAQAAMQDILDTTLSKNFAYEWTDLTYQQILAGNTALTIFPLVVVLVFLVLAAQYESWSLPAAIILIVPMTLISALTGVILWGGENNIFTQIGFIVLVGLACKNAILIVEFARDKEQQGLALVDAVKNASHLRLRPILMTSLAFIMGVLPLVVTAGAGAEMRQAIGITVFSGMIGLTLFGLLFTPVFYYVIRSLSRRK